MMERNSTTLIEKTLRQVLSDKDKISLVHTDLFSFGFPIDVVSKIELSNFYLNLFIQLSKEQQLVFPCFNYSFPKTKIFNVESDLCEVGVLNEELRTRFSSNRTKTPIFSFLPLFPYISTVKPNENVFGIESFWQFLYEDDASILHFGSEVSSTTLIHYVEEMFNAPYRYLKRFDGKVNSCNNETSVTIQYRVRPKGENIIHYDWGKIHAAILSLEGTKQLTLTKGNMLSFSVQKIVEQLLLSCRNDPHYLLTEHSKEELKLAYKKFGYPLTFSAVEASQ